MLAKELLSRPRTWLCNTCMPLNGWSLKGLGLKLPLTPTPCAGDALRIKLEEEELDLRSHPVSIAERVGVVDGSLQCTARVAGVRLALRCSCPADQASGRLSILG